MEIAQLDLIEMLGVIDFSLCIAGENSLVYPGWEALGFILFSRRANGRAE